MNYDEDEYSGINGFVMPLVYMYALFTDFCRYLSMQRPWTCLSKSLSCLQGTGERKQRQDIHVVRPPLMRVNLPQIRKFYV